MKNAIQTWWPIYDVTYLRATINRLLTNYFGTWFERLSINLMQYITSVANHHWVSDFTIYDGGYTVWTQRDQF